MEDLKCSIEKNKKFILILISCILITSIFTIFMFDTFPFTKKQNIFYSIAEDINKANYSLNNCINDSTINTTETVQTLQVNTNRLAKLKTTLSATVISDDRDRLISNTLVSSIDSTQNLYNYIINTLTALEKPTFTESMSQITELKNNCIESYTGLSQLGINIKFSKSNLEFFDSFLNYLMTLDNLSKQQQIKDLQANDFFNSFNSALTDFTNLLEDLQPAINKVRADNRSFDVLINDINQKEIDFLLIKRNLASISIPENCLTYYSSLTDTFNIYSTYLSTIKTALIYEKSSSGYEENKKTIDKNYSNAYSKYHDVKESLESINKSLEDL